MNSGAVMAALTAEGLEPVADAPFGILTTYGVGGNAAVMVDATSESDLVAIGRVVQANGRPEVFVLGNGSNTLVSDSGFDGVVVRVRIPVEGDGFLAGHDGGTVIAPGSAKLPVLARRTVAAGLCGLEWAVGVPGTVGGAVRMNAGGHGSEIVDDLVSARIVSLRTGRAEDVPAGNLGLHFRGSALRDWHVVVSAVFRVGPRGSHDCEGELSGVVAWRRENQPGGRNAGSVFVNPAPGAGSSGALIDSCGLRGTALGGAAVSERHANFIQAGDNATARDIIDLMCAVQDKVAESTGVTLRSETKLVGFPEGTVSRFHVMYPDAGTVVDSPVAGILGDA